MVKVDDDSVVNLPLLERVLKPLRCVTRLYFGAIAFTGFRTAPNFQNCGFQILASFVACLCALFGALWRNLAEGELAEAALWVLACARPYLPGVVHQGDSRDRY